MSFVLACCILCNASNERDEGQDRLTNDKKSKVTDQYLHVVFINRAGGLCVRIVNEVMSTDQMQ